MYGFVMCGFVLMLYCTKHFDVLNTERAKRARKKICIAI